MTDIEPYSDLCGMCCKRRCDCPLDEDAPDDETDDDYDYGLYLEDRHADAVNDYLRDNGF